LSQSAKKPKRTGKTIFLTDFQAEEGHTGGGSTYVPRPVSWTDKTDRVWRMFQPRGAVMTAKCLRHLQLTTASCSLLHRLLGTPISTTVISPTAILHCWEPNL
uniref:Uncharacterized protein n=2 Tax=Sus scrofa TaxID=9823 RepID=A0A8D0WPY7_PIG